MKRDISIVTIGDKVDYDSFLKFHHEKESLLKGGFEYFTANYSGFLDGKVLPVKTKKVFIFLFFPFSYWNKYIEHKNYKGLYGNRTFYRKFSNFWNMIERKARKHFVGKEVIFINNLHSCGAYRDKLTVIHKLSRFGVSQPQICGISGARAMEKRLAGGDSFFLKPRYGSMGKGITFLSRYNWQTNFRFKNNKIISRRSDRGWKFSDVTGNHKFLRQLLKKDILIQEAIDPPILNGYKVDLRIYTFMDKAIYIYPRKNALEKVTTNISQGGQGDPHLLEVLPKSLILKAKREAVKAVKALQIDLGGIDIVPDKNLKDVYVIDVNVFSGFPKTKTFNLPRHVLRELGRYKMHEK